MKRINSHNDIRDADIKNAIFSRKGKIVTVEKIRKILSDEFNFEFDDHNSRSIGLRIGFIFSQLLDEGYLKCINNRQSHRVFRVL